jgi:hypothetical protein
MFSRGGRWGHTHRHTQRQTSVTVQGRAGRDLDGQVVLEEVDLGHVVEGHDGAVAQEAHRRQQPELRLVVGKGERGWVDG